MTRFALALALLVLCSDFASAACRGPLARFRTRAVIQQRQVERTRSVVRSVRPVAPQFRLMYPLFVPMSKCGPGGCPVK